MSRKRKFDSLPCENDSWPPRKRAALDRQSEYIIETLDRNMNGVRSVGTNTVEDVPMRRSPSQPVRHKTWDHEAKKLLSKEDRLDHRKHITREDRMERMVDDILGYYCRHQDTRQLNVWKMFCDLVDYYCE